MSEEETKKDANEQLLVEAFAALREETDGASDGAAETRRLVLLSARKQRRRRLIVARLVLPIAAVFAISTAWAAATGRLPRVVRDLFTTEHPDARPPVVAQPATRVPPPPPVATTVTAVEKPPIEDTPFAPPPAAPSTTVATKAKPAAAAPSSSVAATDPEERLYRAAHEAHFMTRDWTAALTAWDAYIAAHPKGRFAPEARYNRALALVRLGRRDEAKSALAPFADGTMGGYRQREARELLDAMP